MQASQTVACDSKCSETCLKDLDEALLTAIVARLPSPASFAATSRTCAAAASSDLAREAWFARFWWEVNSENSTSLPAVHGLLLWGRARGAEVTALARSVAVALAASPTEAAHAQPGLKQLLEDAPTLLSAGEHGALTLLERAAAPHATPLLLLAAAAGGHPRLLALLQDRALAQYAQAQRAWVAERHSRAGSTPHGTASMAWRRLQRTLEVPQRGLLVELLRPCLIAAASAGSSPCLAVMLCQLDVCDLRMGPVRLDLLVAAAESALAAGATCCLPQLVAALEAPPRPSRVRRHRAAARTSASSEQEQQQQHPCAQQQQQALQATIQQQQQQGGDSSAVSCAPVLQQPDPPPPPQAPRRSVQECMLLSRYCLVAAASNGAAATLRFALANTEPGARTQQLPAALNAAGCAGHVAALKQLLGLPEVSQRPLEVCR
jgi:hypothetical protein